MRQTIRWTTVMLFCLPMIACQSNRAARQVKPVPLPSPPRHTTLSQTPPGRLSPGTQSPNETLSSTGSGPVLTEPIQKPALGRLDFSTPPTVPADATVTLPLIQEVPLPPATLPMQTSVPTTTFGQSTATEPRYVTPPAQAESPAPQRYHVVAKGDTLWRIAAKVYGDGRRWRDIADANNILDTKKLVIGEKLKLP